MYVIKTFSLFRVTVVVYFKKIPGVPSIMCWVKTLSLLGEKNCVKKLFRLLGYPSVITRAAQVSKRLYIYMHVLWTQLTSAINSTVCLFASL